MNRQISFAKYRAIDLSLLAAFLVGSQVLISFAVSRWFPDQLYVASPLGGMVALVMMRWGPWAGIHAVIGGLVFCITSPGSTWEHFLIYGVGNLLSLAALLLFRLIGKERIRKRTAYTLLFGFCVQLLMMLGRAGVAALLGRSLQACWGFIATDALSFLFTLLIVWIVRRIDGLFEDQKSYLLRLQSERQVEGRGQL